MQIDPLGDTALIVRDLVLPSYHVADLLNVSRFPGLIEAVASYETVGVFLDPAEFDYEGFESLLEGLPVLESEKPRRTLSIPICYELGEDLQGVANSLGISKDEVISEHLSHAYLCYAIGFCPGFPFLGYLSRPISGVPRLPSPRAHTEPGSVGITGRQTGIYPIDRPGGWPIIARTPLTLVDEATHYFPIHAGDEILFRRIDESEFNKLKGLRF
ncbi:MAG: allophanate hydrolase subunit 1 [Armatimonadetes bacterium]|nr:allophanate hydrolase subunit 1 [Armatimonadota bacterium]